MVLLRINDDKRTYICSNCGKTIAQGYSYFIDPVSNPDFKYKTSGNKIYYRCRCRANHELIKDSNPKMPNVLKFKYIRIISED